MVMAVMGLMMCARVRVFDARQVGFSCIGVSRVAHSEGPSPARPPPLHRRWLLAHCFSARLYATDAVASVPAPSIAAPNAITWPGRTT